MSRSSTYGPSCRLNRIADIEGAPLDLEAVFKSVERTGRAAIAHYAVQFAGPGAELAACISKDLFHQLKAPVERVGARFLPMPFMRALELGVTPNVERISAAIRATI
jgi:pyruvate dehydrogenase E1 component beta subunit